MTWWLAFIFVMKQLAESTINRNIEKLISSVKFLNDPKYYKNNFWQFAHWESSAAQGKAGGCRTCRAGHYNATLKNKRHTTGDRFKKEILKVCGVCQKKIELKLGMFLKYYCP